MKRWRVRVEGLNCKDGGPEAVVPERYRRLRVGVLGGSPLLVGMLCLES